MLTTMRRKPSTKLLDEKSSTISLKLSPEERERYNEVLRKAKSKFKFVNKSHINRELLGLVKPVALSEADIHYFRTGEK